MTMHTAVYTTTPGVTTRQAFDKMRELIGATDKYRYEHREDDKEVVKVGDKLNGIDPTKIVPIGTTAEIKDSLIAFDWTMFWSGEWWIVVRSDDLVGEVGDRFLPNELSDPYVLTVASVPR